MRVLPSVSRLYREVCACYACFKAVMEVRRNKLSFFLVSPSVCAQCITEPWDDLPNCFLYSFDCLAFDTVFFPLCFSFSNSGHVYWREILKSSLLISILSFFPSCLFLPSFLSLLLLRCVKDQHATCNYEENNQLFLSDFYFNLVTCYSLYLLPPATD